MKIIFLILLFLYWKKEKWKQPGFVFGCFLIFIFGARFIVEFIKLGQTARDDVWFLNRLYSGNFEFTDSDRIWYDNKEGYGIFSYFNDDNFEKLKKISSTVMPGVELSEHDDSNLGKLFVRNNIDHGILTMSNESLISRGRSRIANFFINNTEFEYLFFLDSDVGFDPADVLKLLNHNKELVTGAYPMKTVPLRWNFTLTEPKQIDGSLVAIERIGIGFSLIHRSVFQKIAKKL
jgi:hypothetical protein